MSLIASLLFVLQTGVTFNGGTSVNPVPDAVTLTGVTFAAVGTITTDAAGSDQFGLTWDSNGDVITAFGDGNGFDEVTRCHMGVAKLVGAPESFTPTDLWCDLDPGGDAYIGKPNSGLVSINGTLYIWTSKQDAWNEVKVIYSVDDGVTWNISENPLIDVADGAFGGVGIVQFGQDYSQGDGYVYGYGNTEPETTHAYLFRVPEADVLDETKYQYFSGTAGAPEWSNDIADRAPAFTDTDGVRWGLSPLWVEPLNRFLMLVRHDAADPAYWGIFEAPNVFGPWTEIESGSTLDDYTRTADPTRIAWMHNLVTKPGWMSADGCTWQMVFDRGDEFRLIEMTLDGC